MGPPPPPLPPPLPPPPSPPTCPPGTERGGQCVCAANLEVRFLLWQAGTHYRYISPPPASRTCAYSYSFTDIPFLHTPARPDDGLTRFSYLLCTVRVACVYSDRLPCRLRTFTSYRPLSHKSPGLFIVYSVFVSFCFLFSFFLPPCA